jgi:hypothetical protein
MRLPPSLNTRAKNQFLDLELGNSIGAMYLKVKLFKLKAVMLLSKFDLTTLTFRDNRRSTFEHIADGGLESLCVVPWTLWGRFCI